MTWFTDVLENIYTNASEGIWYKLGELLRILGKVQSAVFIQSLWVNVRGVTKSCIMLSTRQAIGHYSWINGFLG